MRLERRTGQVEAVVIHAELRRHVQLARQVLPDPRELLRGHDVGGIKLPRAVLAELGTRLVLMYEVHVLKVRRRVVPVAGIATDHDFRADHPVLEDERTVRDHFPGAGEILAASRERRTVDGKRPRLRQQARQVGRRVHKPDDHRAVIGRDDAEVGRGSLAARRGHCIRYGLQDLRIRRGGRRIHEAAHARHIVPGDERFPVRPAKTLPQVKGVLESVGRDRPRFRRRRHGTAVRTDRGQPFEQVTEDIERGVRACALRVQRVRLRSIAANEGRRVGLAGRLRRVRLGLTIVTSATGGECSECGGQPDHRRRPPPAASMRVHREGREPQASRLTGSARPATRSRFLRWISSSETAAGVMPGIRAAWPSVAGRCSIRRCRTSFDRPRTCA
jgi:hypothetical protein